MKSPAVLFYTSDFLTGVSNLTMEERGQYITLLMLQHQLGHLSKKTIDINVPNCSNDVLKKFQQDENGLYYQHRMEEETQKREKYVESRYNNGYKGGRPKTKTKPNNNHMDNHKVINMDNHIGNDNDNDNIYNTYGNYKRIRLTNKEYNKLIEDYSKDIIDKQIILLDEYIQSNNNKNKYTDFNLVLRKSLRENWFKNKIADKLPTWFGKEQKKEEMSEEEIKELKDSLESFK